MPYAKSIEYYSQEMRELVQFVAKSKKEVLIETDSPKQARSLSGKYYAMFTAAKKASYNPPAHWSDSQKQRAMDFFSDCAQVSPVPEGNKVRLTHKSKQHAGRVSYPEGKEIPALASLQDDAWSGVDSTPKIPPNPMTQPIDNPESALPASEFGLDRTKKYY